MFGMNLWVFFLQLDTAISKEIVNAQNGSKYTCRKNFIIFFKYNWLYF